MPGPTDEQMERFLGHLLRAGVIVAAGVVLAGSVLYLVHHGSAPAEHRTVLEEPVELRSVSGVLRGVVGWRARAVVQLGLLLLIATPVLRVAASAVSFARQRDWLYVVFTGFVLVLLLASLFGGRG